MKCADVQRNIMTLRWHEGVGIKYAGQPPPRLNLEPSRLYLSCRGVRIGADGVGDFDCLLSEHSGRLPPSSVKSGLVALFRMCETHWRLVGSPVLTAISFASL